MEPSVPSPLAQLAALGIRPKKGLGQHFLVDPTHRARIVAAAGLTPADTVLEVGPGPGVLTELLATQAGRVVAIELDDRLIPFLQKRFASRPHVTIVHGDILKLDVGGLMANRQIGKPNLQSAICSTKSSLTSPITHCRSRPPPAGVSAAARSPT